MNGKMTTDRMAIAAAVLTILALLAVGVFAQTNRSFHFFGPISRVITPNNDARNDTAFFCFENPADSGVSGSVYSLLGASVATMNGPIQDAGAPASCPAGISGLPGKVYYMTWDGKSNGAGVRTGIYVYRVMAEQKAYTGTVIVVR